MLFLLDNLAFPPVSLADEDGLLAISSSFSVDMIVTAYANGIFPWYKDEQGFFYWYSTDPRCVILPEKLKVTKSMQQVLRNGQFRFTMNRCFKEVMKNCQLVERKLDSGTWISDDFVEAYTQLHESGRAISGECWHDGKLVGGCYGVWMNGIFYGESMFSSMSNASKFAFINLVEALKNKGLRLIDCQQETQHMISLGAEMISRDDFVEIIKA